MIGPMYRDVRVFNFDTRHWSDPRLVMNVYRTEHTAVRYGDLWIIHGGYTGSSYSNDTVEFNLRDGLPRTVFVTGCV
jgi:hypothetical protein